MNLKTILLLIENYKSYLKSPNSDSELYKWETIQHFQANWSTEATDLAEMYDKALNNNDSRRQWKGNDFYPKEMMLKLMQIEPEYVRLALRDLFNNDKGIEGRVDRFIFYCNELLNMYLTKNPYAKVNDHHHHHGVVMMYLTCRFPAKYTLYNARAFRAFLEKVGAKNILISHDMERFVKVTKIVNTFLKKDEEIQMLLAKRLNDNHYQEENLLAVHELMLLVK